MKPNNHFPELLVENVADKISQRRSTNSIVKALLFFAIAAVAVVILVMADLESGGWVQMLVGCVAVISFVMVLVSFFAAKPDCFINGEKVRGYEFFFDESSVSVVAQAFRNRDANKVRGMMNDMNKGLRLNIAISENGTLCRYQYYKYVPFEYKPESEVMEFDKSLMDFIEQL